MSHDREKVDVAATLAGGIDLAVSKRDGSTENVRVRMLNARQWQKLAESPNDEARKVEIYCGKDEGWDDQLVPESHESIVLEGDRINADFFSRYVRRSLAMAKALMPGVTERIMEGILSSSQNGSPTSQPRPD